MTLADLGVGRRAVALLAVATIGAVLAGYLIAARLDTGEARTDALHSPPSPEPEAQDNAGSVGPSAPPVPAPTDPGPPPGTPEPAPDPPPAPTGTRGETDTRPVPVTTTATPVPPSPAPTPGAPPSPGSTTPPRGSTPAGLPDYVVPPSQVPAASAAAGRLRRLASDPDTAPATRADIGYVLQLHRRFGRARLPGRRATVERTIRVNAWWYARRPAPPGRALIRDPQGFIYSYSAGHGFALNPVGTTGRWQGLNADVGPVPLAEALLDVAVAADRGGRATLTWEYFDVPGEPRAIRPGASGMAQARVGQVMAGAYRATGDPRFSAAAAQALASLAVDVSAGGTRSMVAHPAGAATSPWYVERAYPGADPWTGGAINGFMVAIIELRAAEAALRAAPVPDTATADEAARLASDGAATLDRYLPLHDSGDWSYYGLRTPGHPWRTYLANATYHCYHVALLTGLGNLYPDASFAATARKWRGYATRAGVTCPGGASAK